MATVVIAYGNRDREAAEIAKSQIESISSVNVIMVDAGIEDGDVDTIDYSDFDGVLAIGGKLSNEVYKDLFYRFGDWLVPGLDLEMTYRAAVNGINYVSGVPVVGISGFYEEDTMDAVRTWTGASNEFTFLSYSGVDDWLDEAKRVAGEGDDEPVPDPGDSIIPDEDEYENIDVPELPVKVEVEGTKLNLPDVEPYSFTVDGWVKEVDSNFDDLGTPQGVAFQNETVEGKTGGGDRDVYVISADATITDFEADGDKFVYINGNRYRYDSDRDAFKESGIPFFQPTGDPDANEHIADTEKTPEMKEKEEKREEEQNQGFLADYLEALKNPTASPDNMIKTATVVLFLLVMKEVAGIGENVSS